MSEMLHHQPRAAVHRNAAIFELVPFDLLTISCSRKNFVMIPQTIQTTTRPQTGTAENNPRRYAVTSLASTRAQRT